MEITEKLPSKEILQKTCKAISVLDAILCSEWEYRFYSYNSRWSEDEEFCEMQDMEGERFQILFKEEGCVINGVHNGYKDADKSILTEGLPEVYQEFLFGEPLRLMEPISAFGRTGGVNGNTTKLAKLTGKKNCCIFLMEIQ